jgi:hypothetical protein
LVLEKLRWQTEPNFSLVVGYHLKLPWIMQFEPIQVALQAIDFTSDVYSANNSLLMFDIFFLPITVISVCHFPSSFWTETSWWILTRTSFPSYRLLIFFF